MMPPCNDSCELIYACMYIFAYMYVCERTHLQCMPYEKAFYMTDCHLVVRMCMHMYKNERTCIHNVCIYAYIICKYVQIYKYSKILFFNTMRI